MKTLFIALSIFISTSLFSQSITNTLGGGGVFTIKDTGANYFTLTQSTGQVNILKTLRLEYTTNPTLGVLYKGTDRFLHNFGANNTFLGVNSGNFTMTGAANTGIGYNSLLSNTTGNSNTALGSGTLFSNTTGIENTAIGYNSLVINVSGNYNTSVGSFSLNSNVSGVANTAFGSSALMFSTASNNTAIGTSSLRNVTTGSHNTGLGLNALLYATTGNQNTAIGSETGTSVSTGSNLTLIGYDAEPLSGASINQITLGNSSVTSLRCNVQTISSLSDMRDKKNIQDLSLGLDFIMKLKPRQFNWDKREWYEGNKSDGSKMSEVPTAGFISQELDEAQNRDNAGWLNLVLKDNPDRLEATYGNLLPVMVKAIQELKVQSEKLKVENEKLKKNNEDLVSEVEFLKSANDRIVKLEKKMIELTSAQHTSLDIKKMNLTNNK